MTRDQTPTQRQAASWASRTRRRPALAVAVRFPGDELGASELVGGNPAKVIRTRFDDATVGRLLRIAWWDWPPDRIAEAIPLISQADVDALEAFAAS